MDLQNPMTDPALRVGATHRLGRPGRDVPLGVVADDLLVRELPEQMPGDRAAEFETLGMRQIDDVVVQLGAGDVGMAVEVLPPGLPHPR
jgi:hypothetical protein